MRQSSAQKPLSQIPFNNLEFFFELKTNPIFRNQKQDCTSSRIGKLLGHFRLHSIINLNFIFKEMSTFAEHLPLKLSPSTVYFEQSFCKGAETIIG